VEIDGVEFKQSRFPVGQFGGSFYDASIGRGPKTFNVLASTDATSSMIGGMMFTGLTETDAYTGETVPHLAKSVEIAPDNTTYTVTLRKGLTWSDGHPLTADDVVFTWNDIILKGLGNKSNLDVVSINGVPPVVRKIDDLTIEFKTPQPFAPFKGNLGSSILPKHVVEPVIRKDPKAFDSFWGVSSSPKSFVVNGPFMMEEYISGQRVVLKRNPNYFMVDAQGRRLPYLDRYVIDFVQDQNAQLLQFEQGHIDSLSVPGNQVFYVKHLQTPEFKMYDLGPASGTTFLVFNLNPRKNKDGKPYVSPIKSAWFRDLNFRKAIDYAVRRDQIVQNILMGVGAPLFTAESLSSVFLNKAIAQGHPSDLEKAREYLRASGFTWDSQGQLHDRHGNRVEFELSTNTGNLERESVGVAIKEDLQKLGIKVNFKPIDFNVLVGRMDTAQWEAIILGLTGSPIEPHGGKNVWESQAALHLFNQRKPGEDMPGTDIIEPWERQIDALFNQGATTLELEKRREIYNQFQQIAYDNVPFIYLYSPNAIVAIRDRIQNLDPTPLGTFHNIESIWVKTP
jgi:peptide/nickel transport system substrate-binding protein